MNGPLWPENIDNDEERPIPFTKTIFIEQGDFAETPPKKWKRFAPGLEVRLRHAYFIKCNEVVKNDAGEVVELLCTYDPQARGTAPDGRKPNGTLHWVSATEGVNVQARLYDRLFSVAQPDGDAEVDFKTHLNPDSLTIRECAVAEPYFKEIKPGTRVQFERQGFFILDGEDSSGDQLVFNRITTLRDSWKKETVKEAPQPKAKKQKPAPVAAPQENRVSQRDQVRESDPGSSQPVLIVTKTNWAFRRMWQISYLETRRFRIILKRFWLRGCQRLCVPNGCVTSCLPMVMKAT